MLICVFYAFDARTIVGRELANAFKSGQCSGQVLCVLWRKFNLKGNKVTKEDENYFQRAANLAS